MDKLTIEHLAPYLPYGLKFAKGENKYMEFQMYMANDNYIFSTNDYRYLYDEVKPILHPLSDLTKEIEHNGRRVILTREINKRLYEIDKQDFGFRYLGLIKHTHAFEFDGAKMGIKALPYWVVNELISHHFDIYGLIDNGLAIDINTIK